MASNARLKRSSSLSRQPRFPCDVAPPRLGNLGRRSSNLSLFKRAQRILVRIRYGVFLTILLSLSLTACHSKQNETAEVPAQVIEMPEMPSDIFLPTKLWDTVTGATFEKSVRQAASILYAPIGVRLVEKTEGVLTAPKLQLNFGKGGGEVDMSKYIKSERGTFQLFFDFEGFAHPTDLSVYYISKTRKRKLDNEVFGSGCRNYYDVKAYLLKVNATEGLNLNVTRDRHDSAVGGYFVFSYKLDKQIFISAVNFVDSKRPDLFCEEKRK